MKTIMEESKGDIIAKNGRVVIGLNYMDNARVFPS